MRLDCNHSSRRSCREREKGGCLWGPFPLSPTTSTSSTARWFDEGLDKISIVLSSAASVEFRSEISAVSVIEETHTGVDTITSFFEDETSDDPWLDIVEPD